MTAETTIRRSYTIAEILDRLQEMRRSGELTVRGDTEGELAERLRAYMARHGVEQYELEQSLYWPADARDRLRRRQVRAIVNRWYGR